MKYVKNALALASKSLHFAVLLCLGGSPETPGFPGVPWSSLEFPGSSWIPVGVPGELEESLAAHFWGACLSRGAMVTANFAGGKRGRGRGEQDGRRAVRGVDERTV